MNLTFEGDLSIQRIAELKTQLVDALAETDELVVNLKDVDKLDLTFLQLLCSAHRTASKSGKFVKLVQASDVVEKAVTDAGFVRNNMACGQECSDSCLWMEQ